MNGIHDLGGFTCFGPVTRDPDEPVFKADWERRVFGMMMIGGATLGPIDAMRHAIERMDPVHYLESSYYEHWLAAVETRSAECDLANAEKSTDTIGAEVIAEVVAGGMPAERAMSGVEPRFKVGDSVQTKNLNPRGHTRLPRYVRGHRGTVHKLHGNHVFPDTAAHHQGENPQPLYSVRFSATELWGDAAVGRDSLYIDLWENYLEAATS